MIVNIATTNVQVIPELNAVNLTITPTLISGAGGSDVTKAYVDQQDSLKVDKVLGKELSTNDFTDELNVNLADAYDHSQEIGNPHQTSFENIQGYPAIPTGKALFDDKTFKEIAQAGGASNQPIYMTNVDSDIAGYKSLSYTQEASETVKTITASNNTVAGEAYLFNLALGTNVIPAGTFEFGYWRSVSSLANESYKQIEIFVRNPDGSEQSLVTFESASIEESVLTERIISRTATSSYNVNPLGRLGVRSKFRTTRNANTTLTYLIGDGRGWWMKSPLPTRHDLLRDKNGNLAYQHIDGTIEKSIPIDNDGLALWDSISLRFIRTKLSDFKTFLANVFVPKTRTINGLDLTANRNLVEALGYAMSDVDTDITLGVKQSCASVPYNFTITGIRAQLGTAAVGILLLTIDVKLNGVSILSTKLTFDSGEKLSETASVPYVLTAPSIPVLTSDTIELSVTQAGGPTTAAKNLTLFLIGYKTI